MRNQLPAKIKAMNEANAKANEIRPILKAIFAPLVGCKVVKIDGSFLASVEKLLPEFPYSNKLHVYRNRSNYSLCWVVKTHETVNGIAVYHETSVYIADLQGQSVKSVYTNNDEPLRTDYNVEEVEAQQKVVKAAKERYEAERSKLYPFDEI